MSGDPQLCSSLISDGFDGEPPQKKSKLYAISSDFESGFARLKRFFSVLRPLIGGAAPDLISGLDETTAFLEAHRDRYLLLETIELDCMTHEREAELRTCVEEEIKASLAAGAAVDALLSDPSNIGNRLKSATLKKSGSPLDAFCGLRLDDDFDSVRDDKTEYPLGLYWDEVLYFELWNKAQFEANR
jgi:hypothetical protein